MSEALNRAKVTKTPGSETSRPASRTEEPAHSNKRHPELTDIPTKCSSINSLEFPLGLHSEIRLVGRLKQLLPPPPTDRELGSENPTPQKNIHHPASRLIDHSSSSR
ncbi:hypothetical protein PGT21_031119 [Puccinia graminis f. sp. tritici]|uniref:Uncharacterized protein n=1 Tax=Puccinia graminis f. sp. tritici TaxID=56615 RepID=A0A5B0NE51_PUCGR|nr:hypothetical protein PGT21_031119 [Puccinia graminis f. sp. tritici]KAA1086290.1 hypothetical protein PGTUg99_004695 [Puccinia graminis f. sp. tritici]